MIILKSNKVVSYVYINCVVPSSKNLSSQYDLGKMSSCLLWDSTQTNDYLLPKYVVSVVIHRHDDGHNKKHNSLKLVNSVMNKTRKM